jgi:hypothetical protein
MHPTLSTSVQVVPQLNAIGIVSSDMGERYAQLRDPDGVGVDLFAAL